MSYVKFLTKKSLVSAAVLAIGVLGTASTASALTFSYTAGGGFVEGTAGATYPIPVVYSGFNTTLDARNTTLGDGNDVFASLNWGAPVSDTQSGATINQIDAITNNPGTAGDLTGTVVVGGDRANLGDVVHHNRVISGVGFGPESVTVAYNLVLKDASDALVFDWSGDFRLEFKETTNTISVGDCSDPSPSGTACDDFFDFVAIAGSDPTTFSYLGKNYNVDITGFWDAAAPGGTLLGNNLFYSAEGGDNFGYVQFAISEVPEPGSLALLGLGLAGLGAMRRRQSLTKAAQA